MLFGNTNIKNAARKPFGHDINTSPRWHCRRHSYNFRISGGLVSQRIAKVEIDLTAAAISNLRIIASVEGGGVPGAESSMLKVKGTEIRQAINDLARRAIGPYALPFLEEEMDMDYEGDFLSDKDAAPLSAQYFNNRKLSIFGGSNEIQKNIVSKMILGL